MTNKPTVNPDSTFVIPMKMGIQKQEALDSRLRGNDNGGGGNDNVGLLSSP